MTALAITNPLPQFFDLDGEPLNGGKLYFGVVNQNPETSPQTVYWDSALTQPAAQPITTRNGYAVRSGNVAVVHSAGDYSISIKDKRGHLVMYAGSSEEFSAASRMTTLLAETAAGNGSDMVGNTDPGGYFSQTPKTVTQALQELANPHAQFAYSYNALRQVPIAKWAAILNRTSTDDHSAYVQAAVNTFGNASSAAQGQVYLPAGLWNFGSAGIVIPYEVGFQGAGGRATHIKVLGDFDAFSWSATSPSFSFLGCRFSDLWITGPGYGVQGATRITMQQAYTASAAGTNLANIATTYPGVVPYTSASAINFNHPWGIDEPRLQNLWIEEFPNFGIRTNQPGGSSTNCFQFADWSQIYLRYCNIGLLFGVGFTGESEFSSIVSQFMLTSCADFSINAALIGAQGLAFRSLSGGWSPYGVRLLAGSTGNLVFDQLHMESCTTAGIYTNASSLGKVILRSPWFAKCPISFKGDAGGVFHIDSGTWSGNGSASDTFITLTAASNFNIKLTGQHTVIANGTAPTNHISAPDIGQFRGGILRKSATTGTINSNVDVNTVMQARGFMSETSTVIPANFSGRVAIGNGSTTVAISFTRSEPDINYNLACAIDWGAVAPPAWAHNMQIGTKTTSGFTVTFGVAAPAGGAVLTWILTR